MDHIITFLPVQMERFLINAYSSELHISLVSQTQVMSCKYCFQSNLIRMALQRELIYLYTCLTDMQAYCRLLDSKVVFLQLHPIPKKYNPV